MRPEKHTSLYIPTYIHITSRLTCLLACIQSPIHSKTAEITVEPEASIRYLQLSSRYRRYSTRRQVPVYHGSVGLASVCRHGGICQPCRHVDDMFLGSTCISNVPLFGCKYPGTASVFGYLCLPQCKYKTNFHEALSIKF